MLNITSQHNQRMASAQSSCTRPVEHGPEPLLLQLVEVLLGGFDIHSTLAVTVAVCTEHERKTQPPGMRMCESERERESGNDIME